MYGRPCSELGMRRPQLFAMECAVRCPRGDDRAEAPRCGWLGGSQDGQATHHCVLCSAVNGARCVGDASLAGRGVVILCPILPQTTLFIHFRSTSGFSVYYTPGRISVLVQTSDELRWVFLSHFRSLSSSPVVCGRHSTWEHEIGRTYSRTWCHSAPLTTAGDQYSWAGGSASSGSWGQGRCACSPCPKQRTRS